ncbi:hypothetical protein SASPL_117706 [Salvia splendens]|uniref:non-specific serine/threonine protein kinase n=1 Tax=Salvia splendens TaxID=180675 RepID=A0A8X8ZWJ5_SALSN|nr:hypothetical protein SASPL_117706 [Salvia splendens]
MGLVLLTLCLLVESAASGLLEHETDCGKYHVTNSNDPSRQLFYINDKLVERYLFCKAMRDDHGRQCFVLRNKYCRSLEKLPLLSGRKSLHAVARDGYSEIDSDKTTSGGKDKYDNPARKKDSGHTLSREPNSTDAFTSLEMNPILEKIVGSPQRVPPSPLRVPPSPSRFSMSPKLNRLGSVRLNMHQVLRATQNFSSLLVIGEGGYGTVYRGKLPDGQVVAIKRARKEHFEALRTEFRSEVELLAKIEHRNLVKLLGYLEKGNERLIITEYVPNCTLREYLDGNKGKILDFNQRLGIAIDVAHGLTYLHLYAAYFGLVNRNWDHTVRLVMQVFRKYNEGRFREMVDPLLHEKIGKEILGKMFGLAIQCAAPTRADRPDMKAVGEQLWGIRMDYNSKPSQF